MGSAQTTGNGRHILITGGAGFIGYHLASALADDVRDTVCIVDNFSRGRMDAELEQLLRRENVDCVEGDVTDPDLFGRLGEGYDEVYHFAAVIGVKNVLERPHEVLRINVASTLLLLDWFVHGGGRKILFSSTSEAYAWTMQAIQLPIPTPEEVPLALTDLTKPRASYAGSKIFGELAVTQYCQQFGKPFTIVRYHNVYGPRMGMAHVIPELYKRARDGEDPLVVYSAYHRRAFCYISDAVWATVAAMRAISADGQTIHIGNQEEEQTIEALARRLLALGGLEREIELRTAKDDPIIRRCPDVGRAKSLLGYAPRVSLEEGLKRTIGWYAQWLDGQRNTSHE